MYPVLFKLGPITIYSYGAFVALAFFITTYLVIKDSPNYGIPKEKVWDLLFIILISGLIGARLLHLFLNFSYYKKALFEIVMVQKGGLAIHGAIVGAILASIIFLLKNRLPLWKTGDLIMQYVPLGQAIGRIGCLLNGCCYGSPTTSSLGLIFPGELQYRHPTQLYSSVGLLVIFIILRSLKRDRRFDGRVFLIYFLIYPPFRFFIDFLRGDLSKPFLGLTVSQLISIVLFITALMIYYWRGQVSSRHYAK